MLCVAHQQGHQLGHTDDDRNDCGIFDALAEYVSGLIGTKAPDQTDHHGQQEKQRGDLIIAPGEFQRTENHDAKAHQRNDSHDDLLDRKLNRFRVLILQAFLYVVGDQTLGGVGLHPAAITDRGEQRRWPK